MSAKPIDDETLFHVMRHDLPWRLATLTECGLNGEKNPTLTRDEVIERVKAKGQRKTELVCCATCWPTMIRYGGGADDVSVEDREMKWAVEREVQRSRWSDRTNPDKGRLILELRALGILVARHRQEFDEIIEDIKTTVPLASQARPKLTRGRPKW